MKIKKYLADIRRAAAEIRRRAPGLKPEVGVILGSGLAGAVPRLDGSRVIPYAEIPGFPRASVKGHAGNLVLGRLAGRGVAVMAGRFHYYEGHSMESIALPTRMLECLGLKTLVVTAAVGSMRPDLKPGHIVVLKDHMNFIGRNPLRGFHEGEFGEMFPDMGAAYAPRLRRLALAACRRLRIPAAEGVYTAVPGPSYETPAEIRAFRRLGGDVVGMSVVTDVIPARQMGVEVLALSWVSNMAAGLGPGALGHAEVLELGRTMSVRLKALLSELLKSV